MFLNFVKKLLVNILYYEWFQIRYLVKLHILQENTINQNKAGYL